ncbi:mitochondrial ribosomal protein L54 [Arctopsyche grandis]|uniref:mitochondrial ribosomal protein L54 n=1 Tax=Arctopsyche grandis TaxID=121162 RepID=UPI00406D8490
MNCRLLLINFGIPALSRGYAIKTVQSSAGMMGLGKGKKPGAGVGGPATVKPVLPVETDAQKLVDYCCGTNTKITGEDVKLGADSDYPDWLWTINVGAPKKLSEMDPTTKAYWLRVRALGMRRNNKLNKIKPF